MVKLFIRLKRFIRGSSRGFTLIELLVALVVASVVLSLALGLIIDQRKLFVEDQTRTQINQNLRAAVDIVGTDIKQAGERLVGNTSFPVVRIINGASGAPDELVLQRNLVDQVLPVCQSISNGSITTSTSTIIVSIDPGASPPSTSCPFSKENVSDPLPSNLQQWKDARCSKDGDSASCRTTNPANGRCIEYGESNSDDRECLWAYIYDPVNNRGEFFPYALEESYSSSGQTRYRIYRNLSSTASKNQWRYSYNYSSTQNAYTNNPVLYILEERKYKLVNNPNLSGDKVLGLVINRQDESPYSKNPIKLVNQLSNFQVEARMQNNTTKSAFNATANTTSPFYNDNWQQLRAVKVDLTDKSSAVNASSKFFPRNAASK